MALSVRIPSVYHQQDEGYYQYHHSVDAKCSETKKNEKSTETVTYEKLLLSCLRLGLSMSDVDELEIGMMIDLIVTNNNILEGTSKEDTIRNATQRDFDAF